MKYTEYQIKFLVNFVLQEAKALANQSNPKNFNIYILKNEYSNYRLSHDKDLTKVCAEHLFLWYRTNSPNSKNVGHFVTSSFHKVLLIRFGVFNYPGTVFN